ncbi:hypothetical protein QYE76_018367 [Lolium multiflorum]|uniref:Uncharacterized protein n=1 Tax=Lolium multiflorum TaxID=4521 RepID=A0AAD8QGA9_LOLMU|nr:hypothetical protein QYE76_018367 [Lolium multiflorum]
MAVPIWARDRRLLSSMSEAVARLGRRRRARWRAVAPGPVAAMKGKRGGASGWWHGRHGHVLALLLLSLGAKTKVLKKEKAQFGVDHEKLVKDLDELDKAHKALKSEYTLLSKSNEQLQIRLASYDVPSSSTPSCDHANIIEENARLKDELAKASSPQSKLSLDDLLSKQRSNNGKEGLGYIAKAKKANKQKAKPAQEKKKAITNGEAPKGNTINDDDAGNANPHYVLFKDYYGDVYDKYVGPYDGYVAWSIWVPKTLVANKRGPIEKWVPKSKN